MKKLTLLFTLLALTSLALAQGGQVSDQAIFGGGVPNAVVRVCQWSSSPTVPCSPTVTIYSDRDLSVGHQISNPTSADQAGNYVFYITPGLYTVQLSSSVTATLTQSILVPVSVDSTGHIPPGVLGSGTADSNHCLAGNGTFVPCIGFAVQHVQSGGGALSDRDTIDFEGGGVSCIDNGTKIVCTVTGGGGGGSVSGSGTTAFIPFWSNGPGSVLADSPYSLGTSSGANDTLFYNGTPTVWFLKTPDLSSSSPTKSVSIRSGIASGSSFSGGISLVTGTSASSTSGQVTLQTGNVASASAPGDITLTTGSGTAGTTRGAGNINLKLGSPTGGTTKTQGRVICGDPTFSQCYIEMMGIDKSVGLNVGEGAPSGLCGAPFRSGFAQGTSGNTIYIRSDASTINTLIYACLDSSSTWTPLQFNLPPIAQGVKKVVGTCTPGSASSYDSCTDTLTWPSAFADTSYVTACSGVQPLADGGNAATNYAPITIIKSYTASTVTVITQQERGATNNFAEIHCIGVHL